MRKKFIMTIAAALLGVVAFAQETSEQVAQAIQTESWEEFWPYRFGIGVNVGGLLDYGTMSINVCVDDFDAKVTAHGGIRWNPWTFYEGTDHQYQARKWATYLGVRWWRDEVYKGWWYGGKMQMKEYNRGGIQSQKTEEGFMAGFGAWGGYMWRLGQHFYLDAGIGLWAGGKGYTVYSCPECGRELESGNKFFVMPDEWLINLVYVF